MHVRNTLAKRKIPSPPILSNNFLLAHFQQAAPSFEYRLSRAQWRVARLITRHRHRRQQIRLFTMHPFDLNC